jgi:tripartite-type tricarboxylate transporter receptor subunit TctC
VDAIGGGTGVPIFWRQVMSKNIFMNRRHAVAAVAAAAMVSPLSLRAQTRGPLRLIVPTDAGSGLDILARNAQVELSNALGGQPVVIENQPAAGGTIGTAMLARAPADGNTIAVVANSHVINQSVFAKLPYHALQDVTPITVIGGSPLVLLVHPGTGVTNIREFAQYLKANARRINYASAGNGTLSHMVTELFTGEVGVKIQHVPYKGVSPMIKSVMTGETAFCMGVVVAVAQGFIQTGALRPLAVSGARRLAAYPSLPTFVEAGYPAADVTSWGAYLAPANLPAGEVARLNEAIRKAYTSPSVTDALAKLQISIAPTTPQVAKEFLSQEYERYAPLIKAAGVRID